MENYATIVWDCDGVILNSNNIKSDAFRAVSLPFGDLASSILVDYHKRNGGISRYNKFNYFIESIMPMHAPEVFIEDKSKFLHRLLQEFSSIVKAELVNCQVAPGLRELRHSMGDQPWYIVSGGDQSELREVFEHRGIADYFNGGIYGSPRDKFAIITNLLEVEDFHLPGLFVGDSRLDHEVARHFGLDFIFLSQWTEYDDWQQYCRINEILAVQAISDILKLEIKPIKS
ncbi:MAG: HAD hydrolase-like protein [Litorivicinaceae bacterium]|nr:HAD hydrolase-like protein [Litorivicinaceae bacterium]